jgi:hypothetical protein
MERMADVHSISVGSLKEEETWKTIIRRGLQGMEWEREDSSLLEWDRALWWGLMERAVNLWFPLNTGNCLSY